MSGGFDTLYQLVSVTTAMCVAATLLIGLACGRDLMRDAVGARSVGWWLLGVFLFAVVLRWLVPPHALFHDHNHGYRYLQVMFDTGPHHYRLEYGIGGFNTFRLFLRFLPESPASVFGLNAVFGALTVFPVYALAAGLWRSRRAGLFAALAIAVLPPHIRLSASEDLYVLAGLFEATALAALVHYVRGGARRHVVLAVAAVVVCVSVRETMNLVPFACVAAVLALPSPLAARLRDRWLWIAGAAAIVVGLPHIVFFARYSLADFGAQAPLFDGQWVVEAARHMVSTYNVYLDPRVVFPSVGVLALLGTVVRFRDDQRAILFTWGCLGVFMYVAFFKSLTDSDRVMFHAHYGIYVAALVGRGCSEVARFGAVRAGHLAATAGIAVVLAVTPALAGSFLRHQSNIQLEYTCAAQGASRVPAGCRLVTLRNGADVGEEPIAADLSGLPAFDESRLLGISAYLSRPRTDAACYVYYEQRICYEPSMSAVFRDCGLDPDKTRYPDIFRCIARYRTAHPEVYQPACDRMHKERVLEPLSTCRVRGAPLDVDPMQPGRMMELGYYRIRPPTTTDAEDPGTPQRSDPGRRP